MGKLRFGIVGQFQSGKSLLINCLLKRQVATVGVGTATTHTVVNYHYSEKEFIEIEYADGRDKHICNISDLHSIDVDGNVKIANVFLSVDFLKDYTLTDLPGFGANEQDNDVALSMLNELDYAIVVVSNDKTFDTASPHYYDFCTLRKYGIPFYFILNCRDTIIPDKWVPCSNINESTYFEELKLLDFYKPIRVPFEDDETIIVNFMWYWYGISDGNDAIFQSVRMRSALSEYKLNSYTKDQIVKMSNFYLIEKIFAMDNKAYLDLKKEIKLLKEEICPVGTIQAFPFKSIPAGWKYCDGSCLEISSFPELYEKIGTMYGGDGKTTFNIPDLRGQFVRGWDDRDEERRLGSIQWDAIQNHDHSIGAYTSKAGGSHTHTVYYSTYRVGSNTFKENDKIVYEIPGSFSCGHPFGGDPGTSNSGEHTHNIPATQTKNIIAKPQEELRVDSETRPKNVAFMYCIRTI